MRPWLYLFAGGVLYAVAVGWAAAVLPPSGVVLHFGAGGAADRFGTRADAVTLMAALGGFLLGVGALVVLLARRGSLSLFNVPNKDYWMAPERRPRLRRMLANDVARVLGGTLVFLVVVPIWTVMGTGAAERSVTPVLFWVPLAGFGAALLVWAGSSMRHRYAVDARSARDRVV